MKHKFLFITLASALIGCSYHANAQTAFSTIEYLDANNIKSGVLVHGDMWWDPSTSIAKCEFPNGSGKHVNHATAVWMAGYDKGSNLHVSAQTYRQNGNDYWPGPLDGNDTLTYTESEKWAKIWKVNKSDIIAFLALPSHTLTNTPVSILEWPGKANPYAKGNNMVPLTVTDNMAPFVDVNSDGMYNPLQGDYPNIKGDQALWWVFSDNGPTHNETNGAAFKVEVHAMAYAYKRNTLIDDVQYYQFTVNNKSEENYSNFRVAMRSDVDLGYFNDDYIGFDSVRRMGYVYNGKSQDGNGEPESYGNNIPKSGILITEMPGDNATTTMPIGSFMYYNNSFSITGNPISDTDFYYYMNSMWVDGVHLKNDYTGMGVASSGHGSGPDVNYVFPGNPSEGDQWSECAAGNAPGDRRFVLASSDFELKAGKRATYVFALVVSPQTTTNGCPNITTIADLQAVADTALGRYTPVSVSEIANKYSKLKIYPNPTSDVVYIDIKDRKANIRIADIMGREVMFNRLNKKDEIGIDVQYLPAGIYNVRCESNGSISTGTFIKE